MIRNLLCFFLVVLGLSAADVTGKWDITWQTPGGERKGVMTVTAEGDAVKAEVEGAKQPIPGTFKDGELKLDGKLFSAEAGYEGAFKLTGKLEGEAMKGSASWETYQMTFVATRLK